MLEVQLLLDPRHEAIQTDILPHQLHQLPLPQFVLLDLPNLVYFDPPRGVYQLQREPIVDTPFCDIECGVRGVDGDAVGRAGEEGALERVREREGFETGEDGWVVGDDDGGGWLGRCGGERFGEDGGGEADGSNERRACKLRSLRRQGEIQVVGR